ncbi:cytochrome P450 [Mucidula mucida]|nr:cytochrome P450 [Mucidula mucida]
MMITLQNALPPGPAYLLVDLLPYVVAVSATSSVFLTAFSQYTGTDVAVGWYVAASILIHPLVRLLLFIYRGVVLRRTMKEKGAIPIPAVDLSSSSIVKTLLKNSDSGYIGEPIWAWAAQYGNTYELNFFGGEKRVVTLEPDHIKAVLATQFKEFEKSPITLTQWSDLLGTGVFNANGDMWKFHRNMTRPFFNKDRISDFDNFERHTISSIALIKARLQEGHPVDFQDVVSRFTLDSATEYLFGKDVESLSAGLPYPPSSNIPNPIHFENHPSNVFVRAFLEGQELIAKRTRYGQTWRLMEFWKNKVTPQRQIVDEFVTPMMKDAFKRKAAGQLEKDSAAGDLLSSLVVGTDDEKAIQDELINILVAGRDTTASLLTFGIYALSRNSEILSKLREEIASVVGRRAPTYDDIRNMKYLRAFLNETLRLYPPVPFDARSASVDTTLPHKGGKPFYVAKNTNVMYSVFLIHRRTDLWGPTALEFDPDRFLDERLQKYLTHNPFIFMPFNAGPRICLGQQFAYNEASYYLVRLLQNFSSFSLASEVQPPESLPPKVWSTEATPGSTRDMDTIKMGLHLTLYAKGGLWVRMTEDKGEDVFIEQ